MPYDKAVQAKHVSEKDVLDAVRQLHKPESLGASTWDVLEKLSQWPEAVVMAKMRSMVRRGLLEGCACSTKPPYCRGDFKVVEKGEF